MPPAIGLWGMPARGVRRGGPRPGARRAVVARAGGRNAAPSRSYDGEDEAARSMRTRFANTHEARTLRSSLSATPAPAWLKDEAGAELLTYAMDRLEQAPFFLFVRHDGQHELTRVSHAPVRRSNLTFQRKGLLEARCQCTHDNACDGHLLVAELFDPRVMTDADGVALVLNGTVRQRYASGSAVRGTLASADRLFAFTARCCCDTSECPTKCYLATLPADLSAPPTIQHARFCDALVEDMLLL